MAACCKFNILFCFFQVLLIISHGHPQVPCFFIFGDSIVDNGNNNNRNTISKANFLPYGIDFPGGPTGRFTNGRTIADFIGEMLGFDDFIPPFASAEDEEILRGVNYGSGGAGILDETGKNFGEVISLNEQLSNHENTIYKITEMLGGNRSAQEFLGSCIYSVFIGSNDYLVNYYGKFSTGITPPEFASFLISHFRDRLQKVYRFGARKVAVFALGEIGCVPKEIAAHGASNGSICVENMNSAVVPFNEKLQILVADLNRGFPDANFVYTVAAVNSTSYGRIRVLDRPCCEVVYDGSCALGSYPCDDRDEYMFWDEVHPSEAANMLFAGVAYQQMAPLYSSPIDASIENKIFNRACPKYS